MSRPAWSRSDLRAEFTRLRDIAQKRIARAKKFGINTNAIKNHLKGFTKLRDIKSNREFKEELKDLRRFVKNKTETTKTGSDKVRDKIYDSLKNKMKQDVYSEEYTVKPYFADDEFFTREDLDIFGTFMNLSNFAEQEGKIMGSPSAVTIYKEMFEEKKTRAEKRKLLKEYAQTVYNASDDKEGTLKELKKHLKYMGLKTTNSFEQEQYRKRGERFERYYREKFGREL